MMVHNFTGRFAMPAKATARLYLSGLLLVVAGAIGSSALAAEAAAAGGESLGALHRVEQPSAVRDWRLDTAVFTEISAVTASEVAVKLPEDQQEEAPAAGSTTSVLAEIESRRLMPRSERPID